VTYQKAIAYLEGRFSGLILLMAEEALNATTKAMWNDGTDTHIDKRRVYKIARWAKKKMKQSSRF
jgi:hypothetical protein